MAQAHADSHSKHNMEVEKIEKQRMAKISKWNKYELNKAPHPTLYIQHKGIWDMDGLLRTITEFFTSQKFKFYEKLQRHRHPGPFGVERYYVFEAYRHRDEHHRWVVWIRLETFDEHDVEVVQKDGTKRMMAKGRLWIQMTGEADIDYDKRWEGGWFSVNLRKFFNRYIIRKRIELPFWDDMYYTILIRLQGIITERLKMESRGNEERYRSGVH